MRIFSIAFIIVGLVFGTAWYRLSYKDSVEKPENKTVAKNIPIVHNISEEPITGNGTLGDAIHNSHTFLNVVLEKGQVKTINFSKNKINLDTVVKYEQGAIQFANKVNASKDIKNTLQKALDETKTAIANQDYNGLYKVEQSLLHLDELYNGAN